MAVTKEQFLAWKANPTTVEFFKYLDRVRENAKEDWANLTFSDDKTNSFALGQVSTIRQIIDLDEDAINDLFEGESND